MDVWFQRYKRWDCQVVRPANCCHLIPSNCFLDGFPCPSQFAAAKLVCYSMMAQKSSESSRPRQFLLLSNDVHLHPGPTTKYPSSVCIRNVTSRGMSYMCNRCSSWVHSKCLVFKTQSSTDKLRTSMQFPTHSTQHHNRFHHLLQLKLPMGIPSSFCNSNCIGNNRVEQGGLQTTQPTSGGPNTAFVNLCSNCVETSHPQKCGLGLPFLDKPAIWNCWMAGAAPHKRVM